MESLFHFVAPASRCGYLPEQLWQLEYEQVAALSPTEYQERLLRGWRRFGTMLFRPRCPRCTACQSLRVLVDRFHPDRSQRRALRLNEGAVNLQIGQPAVSRPKLALYDRFHAHQSETKGWPLHPAKDAFEYVRSFVDNPFPVEEWCFYLGRRLIGVGYVDVVPEAMSAIYFFYDPDERRRCLGTWNVLSIIEAAARRGLAHVYLGYYVADCPSMTYKSRFRPNQVRGLDGQWHDFCP
jgi:arginine-tRNA-protein transferase